MEALLEYLLNHAPVLGLLMVAVWTAWRLSRVWAKAESDIQRLDLGLRSHEAGCEQRAVVVDGKLDRLAEDVAFIRGRMEQ